MDGFYTEGDNLDGMDEGDLQKVTDDRQAIESIRAYAAKAISARSFRAAGRICIALGLERDLEGIYHRLPRALRW